MRETSKTASKILTQTSGQDSYIVARLAGSKSRGQTQFFSNMRGMIKENASKRGLTLRELAVTGLLSNTAEKVQRLKFHLC